MTNNPVQKNREAWFPLPNVRPDTPARKLLFFLRHLCDLQSWTTYRDVKNVLSEAKGSVLEVGCGMQPYRHLVPAQARYSSIDWKGASEHFGYESEGTVYFEGGIFPVPDASCSLVFHTAVLEHVYGLKLFLSECCRVLEKEGRMFFTIPFAVRYHYIPHDYWRLTPASIEKLLGEAGFRSIKVCPRGSDLVVAVTKLNAVLYRIMCTKHNNRVLGIIALVFFGALFSLPLVILTALGHSAIYFKVGSPDDPLGYTVYCQK